MRYEGHESDEKSNSLLTPAEQVAAKGQYAKERLFHYKSYEPPVVTVKELQLNQPSK